LFFALQVFKLFVLGVLTTLFAVFNASRYGLNTGFATCVVFSAIFLSLTVDVLWRPYRFRGLVIRLFSLRQKLNAGIFLAKLLESEIHKGDACWVHRLDYDTQERVPDSRFSDSQHEKYWDLGVVVSEDQEQDESEHECLADLPRHGRYQDESKRESFLSCRIAYHSGISGAEEECNLGEKVVGKSSQELLRHALATVRYIHWTDVTPDLLHPLTQAADLYALSRPCKPGELDYFISHSWQDDHSEKYAELHKISEHFFTSHGRYPKFWLDRACVQPEGQGDTCESLYLLPMYINMASEVVLLVGPTYTKRLWPIWELYSLFVLAPDPEDMAVRVVSLQGGTVDSLANFAVSELTCYNPNTEQRLLSVISTSQAHFSNQIRSLGQVLNRQQRIQHEKAVCEFETASCLGQLACALNGSAAVSQDSVLTALRSPKGLSLVRSASDSEIMRSVGIMERAALGTDFGAVGVHQLLLQLQMPRSYEKQLCDKGGWSSIQDLQELVHDQNELASVSGLPIGHSRKLYQALQLDSAQTLPDFLRESAMRASCSFGSEARASSSLLTRHSRSRSGSIPTSLTTSIASSYIAYSDLVLGRRLGKGANGEVFEAHFKFGVDPCKTTPSSDPVVANTAVKRISLECTSEAQELVDRELRILASLRHPNVVLFIGISQVKMQLL
jgi:hypothetical protein